MVSAGIEQSQKAAVIATTADGCPIGQIRFDQQMLTKGGIASEAVIALSIDRCARGRGLAVELVRAGLKAMQQS